MELLLGFAIAVLIALTGVGAGTMTAPLLILFLHVPASLAIGTALAYSAAVKLVLVPVQVGRGKVIWRTLGIMLLTGIPGVIAGSILFRDSVDRNSSRIWLYPALGTMIAVSSAWQIYRHFRPAKGGGFQKPRPWLLATTMLPVGAEVGFSSSGAGALGTMALLSLTQLETAEVVGTDLAFGLCLSVVGGWIHIANGLLDPGLLLRLVAGGIFGALAGSRLVSWIPTRPMRLALFLWLLTIGIQLCCHASTLVTPGVMQPLARAAGLPKRGSAIAAR